MSRRLLQLNATCNWGSTGRIAEGIGAAAMSRGWESAVAYGRFNNPSSSQAVRVGSKVDVYLHYARCRFADSEGLGSRGATIRLIDWIKDFTPDVIHLHNIHDHWLNYPALFDYLAGIGTPLVWTFHDCWAFTGGCYHFEGLGCDGWKAECRNCSDHRGFLRDRAWRNLELKKRFIGAVADRLTVVGVSKWIESFVKDSILRNAASKCIYNGIDLSVFTPKESKRERMVLGVSNVWTHSKGIDDFMRLRTILPDNVKICLVGLTSKQISSLPHGIDGMERTQNIGGMADLYRRAAVFVNPTYNDTFPTVNLEALACGTPVITYRTGGSPEAVDAKTGLVVPKGNVDSLAKAIMSVMDGNVCFSSDDCRARAEANFDRGRQFGKYVDLYDSILK